jgi:hypothetical protein
MDHAEARELLEVAAVEPLGFERLMAGDTTEASMLAGHLAGCETCADEMTRLRRASGIIRDVVRTTPPPELRERTLAFVREVGRDRGQPVPAGSAGPPPTPIEAGRGDARRAMASPSAGRWIAAIAAGLIVAVGVTGFVVSRQRDDEIRQQAAVVDALGRVTSWYVAIEARPDAQRIDLASPTGGGPSGTVEFSPGSGQLVVVATGLTQPPTGQELRCWFEVDGQRRSIGRMFFGGGLAYWAGPVDRLQEILPGTRFNVSAEGAQPVLVGQL